MPLIPLLFADPEECRAFSRPPRIFHQHFGLGLEPEDFLQPLTVNNRVFTRTPAGYLRNWRTNNSQKDTGSTVSIDKDKFQAFLDVQQFKPEEISVKVSDDVLTIEGKHEEQKDEHGFISRHFVRKYVMPKNCDVAKIESKLSSDGVLTITAPTIQKTDVEHKTIPITQTGEPAKQQAVEQQK
ncbi:hypothetical protein GWI33_018553 [Rhynchophorus ferrugineus]|uniref:SHSP domain-containing protein n=1 Tax=Rhynchophorus ferrugineus TaxID=354439 RepID=A0A834HWS3_RHYFE|nr:hypothetical protein GWI33_018553 [Rhynchophorus ferrugineus]